MAGDLAVTASATFVGAMATDAWEVARSGVVGVFGRSGPDRQSAIETQLDANAARVAQAADPDQIRKALVTVWRVQWTALLREFPEAGPDVQALVTQVREALPPEQQAWVQTTLDHEQAAAAARPKTKDAVNVYPGGVAPGGFYRMGGMGMGMGGMGNMGNMDDRPE